MATILWRNKFSVNNNMLDTHHKEIIRYLNKAVELHEKGYGGEQFIEIITNLFKYARYHLAEEEKYMESIDYPDSFSHQQIHTQYIQDVSILYADVKNNNLDAPEKICTFLKEWWVQHILTEDKKYCLYLEESRSD